MRLHYDKLFTCSEPGSLSHVNHSCMAGALALSRSIALNIRHVASLSRHVIAIQELLRIVERWVALPTEWKITLISFIGNRKIINTHLNSPCPCIFHKTSLEHSSAIWHCRKLEQSNKYKFSDKETQIIQLINMKKALTLHSQIYEEMYKKVGWQIEILK